ncbi:PspA/IM30 family protein [candidate division KSB1 bacterium]|nr:PspA/IM30 family protein [candidate division KSB1 bacterium]RQW03131.1 MAG: PspA/IM30 family protein [candidate division KSB1 bacterium]
MSVFQRMFKVGEAKVNELVDKMEKPEVMLDQAIRDKEKQISTAKKSVMNVIATERQTKAQLDRERNEQTTWEAKAEQALKSGREDLAVKALERAAEHQKKADDLQGIWQSQRDNVDQLKVEITKMEDELAEFRRNKDFIIAQAKTAEVKKQIYEAKAKIKNDKSADDLMARMKAKAERASYEASAAQEMADTVSGDSLEKEFASLDTTSPSADVQSKLDALKAKIGS